MQPAWEHPRYRLTKLTRLADGRTEETRIDLPGLGDVVVLPSPEDAATIVTNQTKGLHARLADLVHAGRLDAMDYRTIAAAVNDPFEALRTQLAARLFALAQDYAGLPAALLVEEARYLREDATSVVIVEGADHART